MFSINYYVSRSVLIDAKVNAVYKILADFKKRSWDPWSLIEPEAVIKASGKTNTVGAVHGWDGKYIGKGTLTNSKLVPDKEIEQDLVFIKPFKSTAKVGLRLKEIEGKTEVEWWMEGHLPFFLFFMKKNLSAWISADYDRGLNMLKSLIETGKIASALERIGVVDCPNISYIGIKRTCATAEMPKLMAGDFQELFTKTKEANIELTGNGISIYENYDMVNASCTYIAGLPVAEDTASLEPFIRGNIKADKAYKVVFTGNFKFLGNAWSAAMSYMRGDKLKHAKSYPPFEVYASDVINTYADEQIVHVYMPLK